MNMNTTALAEKNSETSPLSLDAIGSTIQMVQSEIKLLATEEISTVGRNIKSAVEQKMAENPYQTLATALNIGFGLTNLRLEQVKVAAIQIGKLMAMRSLSNIEATATNKTDRGTNENESLRQ